VSLDSRSLDYEGRISLVPKGAKSRVQALAPCGVESACDTMP
jgi:hypothetical protein